MSKELDMELPKTFFHKLRLVIKRILSCDDELAIRCIEHRLALLDQFSTEYDEVLESEEFYDACDKETAQAAVKHVEKSKGEHEQRRRLQREVLDGLREHVREKHGDPHPETAKKKAKRHAKSGLS